MTEDRTIETRGLFGAGAIDFESLQSDARWRSRQLTVLFTGAVAAVAFTSAVAITAVVVGLMTFLGLQVEDAQHEAVLRDPSVQPEVSFEDASGLVGSMDVWLWVFLGSMLFTAAVISWITHRYQEHLITGGGRGIARDLGGRSTDGSGGLAERRFVNTVHEMALAAGVAPPQVYVLDAEPGINVFNAGWTMDTTVIGVTAGALHSLSREELQAVAAQAMAHVFHGDARSNLRLMAMVTGIAGIAIVGEGLIEASRRGYDEEDDRQRVFVPGYVGGHLIKAAGWVGTWLAGNLQRSVARHDELLADATAIQLTRDPDSLVRAFRRAGGHTSRGAIRHGRRSGHNHLFMIDSRGKIKGSVHPDLRHRILRLDPTWTGGMLEAHVRRPDVTVADGISVEPGLASGFEPVSEDATSDPLAPVVAMTPLVAMAPVLESAEAALEAVGGDPSGGLAVTGTMLAADLIAASEVPRGARAILLGTVLRRAGRLDTDGAGRLLAEHGSVEPGLVEVLRILVPALEDGPEASRLFDLIGRRAAEAEEPADGVAVEALRGAVGEVVADPRKATALDEWMFAEFVEASLQPMSDPKRRCPLEKRRAEFGAIVTLMAHLGGADPAIAANVAGHAAGLGSVTLRGTRALGLPGIHKALDGLADVHEADRRRILTGLAACAGADADVSAGETELLRLVAYRLGVPWDPALLGTNRLGEHRSLGELAPTWS